MIESSISLKYSEIFKLYIDCSFKFLNVENSKFWQLAFKCNTKGEEYNIINQFVGFF